MRDVYGHDAYLLRRHHAASGYRLRCRYAMRCLLSCSIADATPIRVLMMSMTRCHAKMLA